VSDELSDEFLNNELSVLIDEVIDDKSDDEVIAYVLSQLKEKHVVDVLFYYNVLIFDNEHFKLVRHETSIVQLIKTDQIKRALKNVKCVRERDVHSSVVYLAEQSDDVLLHCDRRTL
jgi:hypothetical protein